MKSYYFLFLSFVFLFSCTKPEKDASPTSEETPNSEKVEVNIPRNQVLTKEQQITSALFAAPKEMRENAKVYGYNSENEFVVLREGTNEFVCIADNPKKDGFQIAAYHISLEPYMTKGRDLDAAGKGRQEKEEARSSEAKSGELKMPENPATLHLYYGKDGYYDTQSDSIKNAKYRYVVYIPYATQASTGLSLSPNKSGHPWLMFPGAYNAHIMITPKD